MIGKGEFLQSDSRGGNVLLASLIAISLLAHPSQSLANMPDSMERASVARPIAFPHYPVVLTGSDLPALQQAPIETISLYRFEGNTFGPIPFQIDRRNRKGEYQIPSPKDTGSSEGLQPFDENDECVFMASDLGVQLNQWPDDLATSSATEIGITDPKTGQQSWVYALAFDGRPPETASRDYVSYHRNRDSAESEVFEIGFSRTQPLLVQKLAWKDGKTRQVGMNLVDTMKVRHTGKLFHRFNFLRNQQDYKSRIIGVKDGPVRVIRRTDNRIRMLWGIDTLSFDIDFLIYANAFFMDSRVFFPFRTGWFFSDLAMVSTIDGNDDPALPTVRVYSSSAMDGLVMDGEMSQEEKSFNASGDTELVVVCAEGNILFTVRFEKGFPVRHRAYLVDDKEKQDPPERIPGQFGNVGFRLTRWERVDTKPHHMMFLIYMVPDISVEQGLQLLKGSPNYLGR
jgi:hypothetical protein